MTTIQIADKPTLDAVYEKVSSGGESTILKASDNVQIVVLDTETQFYPVDSSGGVHFDMRWYCDTEGYIRVSATGKKGYSTFQTSFLDVNGTKIYFNNDSYTTGTVDIKVPKNSYIRAYFSVGSGGGYGYLNSVIISYDKAKTTNDGGIII